MEVFNNSSWAYGLLVVVVIGVFALVAFALDQARDADRLAEHIATDTSTKTTALAQGWLVQFKSDQARWQPCLSITRSAGSPMTFAIFATPGEAEQFRDARIKQEAERIAAGVSPSAPEQRFRIVRARLEFA